MSDRDRDTLFRELYDRYYRSVVAYFIRFGLSREDARNLAQDVFVRVYRRMDHYRGDAPWSYLQQAARRAALNEIRRRKTKMRAATEVSLDELSEPPRSPASPTAIGQAASDPEQDLIDSEKEEERQRRRKWLRNAIADLPDDTRRCLLAWLGGLKYHQIAQAFGLTLDAVKSRLHDARIRLRARLGEDPTGLDWPEAPRRDTDDRQE